MWCRRTAQPQHSRHHSVMMMLLSDVPVSTLFTTSVTSVHSRFRMSGKWTLRSPNSALSDCARLCLPSARSTEWLRSTWHKQPHSLISEVTLSLDSGMCVGRESLTGLSKSLASAETRQSGLLSVACCRETVVTI